MVPREVCVRRPEKGNRYRKVALNTQKSAEVIVPPLNTYHFRQRLTRQTRQTPGFPRSLYIRAESFKAGAIFYFRHITSPIYIV